MWTTHTEESILLQLAWQVSGWGAKRPHHYHMEKWEGSAYFEVPVREFQFPDRTLASFATDCSYNPNHLSWTPTWKGSWSHQKPFRTTGLLHILANISLLRGKYHREEKDAGNYAELNLLIISNFAPISNWLLRIFKALHYCCSSLTSLTVISLQISL